MLPQENIARFWDWFAANSTEIGSLLDRGDAKALALVMNTRVKALHPDLAWELGPGKNVEYALTITAASNRTLRPALENVISAAPSIEGWEFYPARQPRPLPSTVQYRDITLATGSWRFISDRAPGGKLNITIVDRSLAQLGENDAITAVFIFLDAVLGEDLVEEWIGEISCQPEGCDAMPITELREYLLRQG